MKVKDHFMSVTPFSKALAMVLFVALPFGGFYAGRMYQKLVFSTEPQKGCPVVYNNAKKQEVTPTAKLGENQTVFEDFSIPEIKTSLKIPSFCSTKSSSDPYLKEGNADYAITCKYPNKEATILISVNPTITGGGFGGLDLANMGGNSYSKKEEPVMFMGNNYTALVETAASYGNKTGFYYQGRLNKKSEFLNPVLKLNSKEVVINYSIEDTTKDASEVTNEAVIKELKKILSSARSK